MNAVADLLITRVMTLCLVLLVFCAVAWAAPVTTILNSGDPSNRVDVAVLGDGYTAAELSTYANDVQTFVNGMFAQVPYAPYLLHFNIHRVDVTSPQSGADHPERGVLVDTALDGTYNCAGIQRLICVNGAKVNQVLTESLAAVQRDMVIVLVNDPEYGGAGGSFAVASTHGAVVEIVLHEIGHSFGGLADEYTTQPPACFNSVEPSHVNATRLDTLPRKWQHWIEASTPIPTTTPIDGVVGLYEGARYCPQGLYRPTWRSKMGVLGVPFWQVNTEQLVKQIYSVVSPIDAVSPAPGDLLVDANSAVTFSVDHPQPMSHDMAIEWRVDGTLRGTQPTFTLPTGGPGTVTVTLLVRDPTPMVRQDPQSLMHETATWTVTVPRQEPNGLMVHLQPVDHAWQDTRTYANGDGIRLHLAVCDVADCWPAWTWGSLTAPDGTLMASFEGPTNADGWASFPLATVEPWWPRGAYTIGVGAAVGSVVAERWITVHVADLATLALALEPTQAVFTSGQTVQLNLAVHLAGLPASRAWTWGSLHVNDEALTQVGRFEGAANLDGWGTFPLGTVNASWVPGWYVIGAGAWWKGATTEQWIWVNIQP